MQNNFLKCSVQNLFGLKPVITEFILPATKRIITKILGMTYALSFSLTDEEIEAQRSRISIELASGRTDFLNVIFITFFPLPFIPLIPLSPQQSPHCCPCPRVLFPFCSIPPPLSPYPLAVIPLSIYESVPIFTVSSVCSLDSTYK